MSRLKSELTINLIIYNDAKSNSVNDLRKFSSIEDILEDLVMMADLRVAEFRPEIPLLPFPPFSLRFRLNDVRECRLKSFRLIPAAAGLAELKGRLG